MSHKKPTKLKKLQGTYRPGRAPKNEPVARDGPVAMPRGVLPQSARKLWREWAAELEAVGMLTPLDGPMFMLAAIWGGVVMDAAKCSARRRKNRMMGRGSSRRDERGRGEAKPGPDRVESGVERASPAVQQRSG